MRRKRLYSFYCHPCDNAWLSIMNFTIEPKYKYCEFCKRKIKGEVVPEPL